MENGRKFNLQFAFKTVPGYTVVLEPHLKSGNSFTPNKLEATHYHTLGQRGHFID